MLVDLLTAFYRNATRVVISGHEYRSALQKKIRTNADECLQLISHAHRNRLRVILGRQLVYLHCAAALLNERARAGRIIEGHGDLRPEHVYLESPPIVIDCIEFSSQMRRLDVLDDLAFLAMELERSGHSATGERIVSACQASLDDVAEPQLIKFHKAHHALVRAKVMMLQAAQLPSDGRHTPLRIAQQYINWAEHNAGQLGHPLLIIVGGLMGTGKSTLANRVAEAIGAAVLSTDQIRRKLYGRSTSPADYGVGNYAPDRRANTYDQLFDSAADLLDKDRWVILDGTFLQHKLREHAASMARRHGSIAFYVHCTCPRHVAIERLTARAASREGDSEGRPDLFDEQSTCQEPLSAEPRFVSIDTTQEINEQCQKVFEAIAVLEPR
jgi:predicted kinase